MDPLRIQAIKRAVSSYAPPLFWAIRHSRRIIHRERNHRLQATLTPWKAKFIRDFGFVVQSGPFTGMTFHSSAVADVYLPLLIGSYEAETHGFIESALAREPTVIIDVGCEAGFVAVGLALRRRRQVCSGSILTPRRAPSPWRSRASIMSPNAWSSRVNARRGA